MKYPRTRQGMARRKARTMQFNPSNGEPHNAEFIALRQKYNPNSRRKLVVPRAKDGAAQDGRGA